MKGKGICLWLCLLIVAIPAVAQKGKKDAQPPIPGQEQAPSLLTEENRTTLKRYEHKLQEFGDSMLDGNTTHIRDTSLKLFTMLLKRSLQIPGSYEYPFDSLKFMKILEPPDKAFRMYNWTMKFDDGSFFYMAAIQMNTKDGSLKLIPLRDRSIKLDTSLEEVILDAKNWYGALYTKIAEKKIKGTKYYFLLGWNGYTRASDQKILEVLTFDKSGIPILGAPLFQKGDKTFTRLIFTYAADAAFLLNYLEDQNAFSFDHLTPATLKEKNKPFLWVPDGSYDYYQYKKGKYIFSEDLFKNVKGNIKEAGE